MTAQQSRLARFLLILTVVLIGLNLRPFITSIGPLASDILAGTGLGLQGMSLLTLVPMLLMGVLAFTAPALLSRYGGRRLVVVSLGIVAAGCALRLAATGGAVLILSAAVAGLGVAIAQAAFPGIVKREFPQHVGPMMGLYSAMLMLGGATGSLLSPMVARATGAWTQGLAFFALPALLTMILAARCLPSEGKRGQVRIRAGQFLARPRAWLLMLCFGLINGGYSTIVAWLAPAYQALGWDAAASGHLFAVLSVSQAIVALSLPVLARKQSDRRPWLWLTLALQAVGYAGLAVAPAAMPLTWGVILGAGLGGSFALMMVIALDHLHDAAQAGALSALMQGGGFLLAAIPPWLVAWLHELTGSYAAGWLWHLGCVAAVSALALRLDPKGYARALSSPHGGDQSPERIPRPRSTR